MCVCVCVCVCVCEQNMFVDEGVFVVFIIYFL